ncbi:caffeic acid 3-O-methyltransferase-like [Pyrus ussuriensis x Pyrus communis]|uniref:Caffeic acid 3-O-methyltransferase-like n=1 Tax=Pyrus ussuriensis x Pyrus communis TaxID=2448454 RepID=A0A5N5G5H3_9ROSA|nr:caffeic acid 3-O-methyltransferase-like [Pyrus ussuriensis x Pyrus communis]
MSPFKQIYMDFEGQHTLVDMGGGDGTILNMIISKHPTIKDINSDFPSVVKSTMRIARDMFVRIPKGDAIFMKVTFLGIIQLLIYIASSKANIYFG